MEPKEVNLASLAPYFCDEGAAWKLLEKWRWPSGPICPHCGSVDHAYFLTPKAETGSRKTSTGARSFRRLWKCADCRRKFSVLVGTIFEDTKIPIAKWLMTYHLLSSAKNGISAKEVERLTKVSYKSAWFMCHRIRHSLEQAEQNLMTGSVAADETYVGGKVANKHRKDRASVERARDKVAVVTLVSRDGEARSQALERVDRTNLAATLLRNVDTSATLMTDELRDYGLVSSMFAAHQTVVHSRGQYARKNGVSTNAVEGFFSQLKRSIDGTHHHVSRRHLSRYLAEFDFRYNTRKISDGERTIKAIRQTTGRRLMWDKVTR